MTRLAIVEKQKCKPEKCDWLCMKMCPINRTGKECISQGEDHKARISEALCTGCGICPKRCPTGAISIINLPEELTSTPIHRYGPNQFALYSLPTPMFGKVVGILGKNGIGKSTAIKILAGVLEPNLGDHTKKADIRQLIDFFKGSEAQVFFEKVRDKKVVASYKPQNVDIIPKMYKGKVRGLLEKVDEKRQLAEIAKRLEIDNILDNEIETLSGGELQRVAIAASVLKKANLYIFDEPTSYMDIKQRLKISSFIKELATEDTAVVVVEHDLIILDYMTDLVHIMYGKEGCYGVVGLPKTAKVAINVYLSGYLKEENVRFREKKIEFFARPPVKHMKREILTSWQVMEKKLGRFELTAEMGKLDKKVVVGVLGENAIGKTSFVKMLAGVIEPDKGKIDTKIKVSYKPQYISGSDDIVANVLREAMRKFHASLIEPLQIEPLLMSKLSELSGGELQRVAICLCLSQEADLFLLDEPSAYLDVEQRLLISKLLKDQMEERGKTALVVDHDLLFLDYISDELMVFEGVPSERGESKGPFTMEEGMNLFLKDLGMTFRRDAESHRPRANKPGSVKDREQIAENKLYYS